MDQFVPHSDHKLTTTASNSDLAEERRRNLRRRAGGRFDARPHSSATQSSGSGSYSITRTDSTAPSSDNSVFGVHEGAIPGPGSNLRRNRKRAVAGSEVGSDSSAIQSSSDSGSYSIAQSDSTAPSLSDPVFDAYEGAIPGLGSNLRRNRNISLQPGTRSHSVREHSTAGLLGHPVLQDPSAPATSVSVSGYLDAVVPICSEQQKTKSDPGTSTSDSIIASRPTQQESPPSGLVPPLDENTPVTSSVTRSSSSIPSEAFASSTPPVVSVSSVIPATSSTVASASSNPAARSATCGVGLLSCLSGIKLGGKSKTELHGEIKEEGYSDEYGKKEKSSSTSDSRDSDASRGERKRRHSQI